MLNLMAWIGKLIGTVMAGPGAVVLGDPGLNDEPGEKPWSPMTYRVLGVVVALSILVIGGVPWQLVGIVALAGAGLVAIEWLRGRRRRD